MRKLTYGYIKGSFESKGYKLLSKIYINSKSKLIYTCPSGNKHSITWSHWQQGGGCPCSICMGYPTIFEVRASFENNGYEFLSDIYINNKNLLEYKCPNGNVSNISWANWKKGTRCRCYACRRESYLLQGIRQSGSNHWNWRGGITNDPYGSEWTMELRNFVRNRDNNRCLNPYCYSKSSSDLTVHHIDYDKKNCIPKNLITVCRVCNNKANKNREWHKAWYQAIISRRYYL